MPVSALAERGAPQQIAGAAFDVFMETIRQAAVLKWFHQNRQDAVRKMSGSIGDTAPWHIYGQSLGFDRTTDNVSGGIEGLRLNLVFVWPEEVELLPDAGETGVAEAGIADLDFMIRIAVEGGRDAAGVLHVGNPTLLWRDNADPLYTDWPNLPTGLGVPLNTQTAAHGIPGGILPTDHQVQEVSLSESRSCMMSAATWTAVFGVVRTTC